MMMVEGLGGSQNTLASSTSSPSQPHPMGLPPYSLHEGSMSSSQSVSSSNSGRHSDAALDDYEGHAAAASSEGYVYASPDTCRQHLLLL